MRISAEWLFYPVVLSDIRQLDLGDMDWPDRYVAGIIEL